MSEVSIKVVTIAGMDRMSLSIVGSPPNCLEGKREDGDGPT